MQFRDPPETGQERDMLQASLDNQRAIVQWKVQGLTPEQGAWTTGKSATSLFGLVKHLALAERWWFVANFSGGELVHPYDFEEDPDAEFRVGPDDTLASVLADYDDAIAVANEIIEHSGLDDLARRPWRRTGRRPSLRWIMVHMIEETSRHAGHADVLRELVDGATGYLPESS